MATIMSHSAWLGHGEMKYLGIHKESRRRRGKREEEEEEIDREEGQKGEIHEE